MGPQSYTFNYQDPTGALIDSAAKAFSGVQDFVQTHQMNDEAMRIKALQAVLDARRQRELEIEAGFTGGTGHGTAGGGTAQFGNATQSGPGVSGQNVFSPVGVFGRSPSQITEPQDYTPGTPKRTLGSILRSPYGIPTMSADVPERTSLGDKQAMAAIKHGYDQEDETQKAADDLRNKLADTQLQGDLNFKRTKYEQDQANKRAAMQEGRADRRERSSELAQYGANFARNVSTAAQNLRVAESNLARVKGLASGASQEEQDEATQQYKEALADVVRARAAYTNFMKKNPQLAPYFPLDDTDTGTGTGTGTGTPAPTGGAGTPTPGAGKPAPASTSTAAPTFNPQMSPSILGSVGQAASTIYHGDWNPNDALAAFNNWWWQGAKDVLTSGSLAGVSVPQRVANDPNFQSQVRQLTATAQKALAQGHALQDVQRAYQANIKSLVDSLSSAAAGQAAPAPTPSGPAAIPLPPVSQMPRVSLPSGAEAAPAVQPAARPTPQPDTAGLGDLVDQIGARMPAQPQPVDTSLSPLLGQIGARSLPTPPTPTLAAPAPQPAVQAPLSFPTMTPGLTPRSDSALSGMFADTGSINPFRTQDAALQQQIIQINQQYQQALAAAPNAAARQAITARYQRVIAALNLQHQALTSGPALR